MKTKSKEEREFELEQLKTQRINLMKKFNSIKDENGNPYFDETYLKKILKIEDKDNEDNEKL